MVSKEKVSLLLSFCKVEKSLLILASETQQSIQANCSLVSDLSLCSHSHFSITAGLFCSSMSTSTAANSQRSNCCKMFSFWSLYENHKSLNSPKSVNQLVCIGIGTQKLLLLLIWSIPPMSPLKTFCYWKKSELENNRLSSLRWNPDCPKRAKCFWNCFNSNFKLLVPPS